MLLRRQLEFAFEVDSEGGTCSPSALAKTNAASPPDSTSPAERPIHLGRDHARERKAHDLLGQHGFRCDLRVEWNARLKTCAGRADFRENLITLNPRLHDHPHEIERTFLHELAHMLAHLRVGRRRISPHGSEWREACRDLGIADEKRCHNLPFPITERIRRFLYRCPNCAETFPRVRKIRRAIACLACCRAHNGGEFDSRFRLQLCSGGL
jgi:SprT protein